MHQNQKKINRTTALIWHKKIGAKQLNLMHAGNEQPAHDYVNFITGLFF